MLAMKCKREIVIFAMKCIEIPAICKNTVFLAIGYFAEMGIYSKNLSE
jgi:hypothetical protein